MAMKWTLYRWVWRLEAPLFIGMPPAGTLNRCRLYISALAMHGAVAAELARINGDEQSKFPDYGKFGREIGLNCRFTYLYPAEKREDKFLVWTPEYSDEKGLYWHCHDSDGIEQIADRDFKRRLLDSQVGTAISPETDSAHEATLRETECINPYWRALHNTSGKPKPVFLLGYIFLRNNGFCQCLKNIGVLFVGGDTRYGLGKLRKEQWDKLSDDARVFGRHVELDREDPVIESKTVFGHAPKINDTEVFGNKELFTGWEVKKIRDGKQAWVPGSCLKDPASWHVDRFGLWILDSSPNH